jgi:hypothetical protein
MLHEPPPASVLTISANVQNFNFVAKPVLFDIISWVSVPQSMAFQSLVELRYRSNHVTEATPVAQFTNVHLLADVLLALHGTHAELHSMSYMDCVRKLRDDILPRVRRTVERKHARLRTRSETTNEPNSHGPPLGAHTELEPEGMAMRISAHVVSPAIFLVDDPVKKQPACLGLTTNMKVWLDISAQGDMSASCDIHGLRSFRVSTRASRVPPWVHFHVPTVERDDIMRPCSLALFYASRPARDVRGRLTGIPSLLQARVSGLYDVRLRVGYRDLLLAQRGVAVLLNSAATANLPTPHSDAATPASPPPPPPKTMQTTSSSDLPRCLSMHVVCVLPRVEALLVNDISGMNLPLVAFRAEQMAVSVIGSHFQARMMAQLGVTISADYYNPIRSTWEAFIEPWRVSLRYFSVRSCMRSQ